MSPARVRWHGPCKGPGAQHGADERARDTAEPGGAGPGDERLRGSAARKRACRRGQRSASDCDPWGPVDGQPTRDAEVTRVVCRGSLT